MASDRSGLCGGVSSVLVLLAVLLGGCGAPDHEPAAGDVRKAPVQRIITLAPHLTELVYAAGAGDRLVGVVAFSDFPPEAAALPQVGDAFRLDYEAIAGLHPDLILAWRSGNPADMVQRLRRLDFDVHAMEPTILDDVAEHLQIIGRLAGTEAVADAAAADYRQTLAQLRLRYQEASPVRVFYQVSAQPLFTVSRAHVIGQAIELCGGKNIFAQLVEAVPPVSVESVLEAAPEVILASAYADRDVATALSLWSDWPRLPAVRSGNLYLVDADRVSRPGTRILGGIAQLCETLEQARANIQSERARL